jgi:Fe-Mn family superoxide dismutase
MSKLTKGDIIRGIQSDLGLEKTRRRKALTESYVTQAKKYDLQTELLSNKTKRAHYQIHEKYITSLNEVSAKLDSANREEASLNHSEFRSLKIDESYNINAAFLHALFFENISDLQSKITMDSMTFLRIERDFGSFDDWQKDFIACALSARNGWVVTVYNTFLNRYMNVVVDLHHQNIPFASYPVLVLDCWEHSYYRDYLSDRKTYVFAMMKELDWDVVEERVKRCERIAKTASITAPAG